MDLYLASERHPHVVAHVDAYRGAQAGQRLTMYFDLARLHFFEQGENGKSIATNDARR
jgi:hypothetical protein